MQLESRLKEMLAIMSAIDKVGKARESVLEIGGLEQHLKDAERPEEFVVYVRDRIRIHAGDFVALLGPSGCGKTTLLTVLGLLRAPTNPQKLDKFSIWVGPTGHKVEIDLRDYWLRRQQRQIETIRRKHIGFALQSGELLPALTVAENIAAPLRLNGVPTSQCKARVSDLIEAFGLRQRAEETTELASIQSRGSVPSGIGHVVNGSVRGIYDLAEARANKLSGGEYQRVSLARSIAHRPTLVFVDEPTAALNRELARGALKQFQQLQAEESGRGATIMITHDEELADEFATVVIRMRPIKGRGAGEVVDVQERLSNSRPDL